ncbi:MAG: MEDS domain-containing protein [Actinomycetota bacterium]
MRTETKAENGPLDHLVQFYQDESDLHRVVGRYLADGLHAGGIAIAATTPANEQAFEGVIRERGEDPDSARGTERLVVLDAAEIASRAALSGVVDAHLFDAAVAEPLRRAAESGRRLFIFGEIVALLWDAGQVVAAIDLEERWNRLRAEIDFSLLCSYPAGALDAHDDSAFADLRHLHSAVLGAGPGPAAPGEVLRLSSSLSAPKQARAFMTKTLAAWGRGDLIEDAALLITELTANVVVHARSDLTIAISRRDAVVRIAVHDESLISPLPRGLVPTSLSGRGLVLVEAMAVAWGSEVVGEGKTVWVELAAPAAPRPPAL